MNRHDELVNARLWADLALDHFGLDSGQMPCVWNGRLTGAMGRAKCSTPNGSRKVILEFSPKIFERATPAQREETAAHEAAHGVVWLVHGRLKRGRKADHHGPVWQSTMRALGFEPKRCHTVDTAGLGRKTRKLSCALCGIPLGSCTPKRAEKLQTAPMVKLRCCGWKSSSVVLVEIL